MSSGHIDLGPLEGEWVEVIQFDEEYYKKYRFEDWRDAFDYPLFLIDWSDDERPVARSVTVIDRRPDGST